MGDGDGWTVVGGPRKARGTAAGKGNRACASEGGGTNHSARESEADAGGALPGWDIAGATAGTAIAAGGGARRKRRGRRLVARTDE